MLSLAEHLLKSIGAGIASDFSRWKEQAHRKYQASVDSDTADAVKKMAEVRALLAKADAEAAAARVSADAQRLVSVADAMAKLFDAVAKLRDQGGQLMFSEENLKEIIQTCRRPPDDGGDKRQDAPAPPPIWSQYIDKRLKQFCAR